VTARAGAETRAAVAEAAVVGLDRDVNGLKQERAELSEKLEATIGRASAAEARAAGLTERAAELVRVVAAKKASARSGQTRS
jgi:hypothetical protein